MKKFLVITKIPPKQGLLGTVPGKTVLEEVEIEDGEDFVTDGFHVPLGGEVLIVPMDVVTTIRSKIVNEVV